MKRSLKCYLNLLENVMPKANYKSLLSKLNVSESFDDNDNGCSSKEEKKKNKSKQQSSSRVETVVAVDAKSNERKKKEERTKKSSLPDLKVANQSSVETTNDATIDLNAW